MITIFSAACDFIISHSGEITSAIIGHATYEGLKSTLDFNSLKNRIRNYFANDQETEIYLEKICNTPVKNQSKPYRDIEDTFEAITGKKFDAGLYKEIETWVQENKEAIISTGNMEFQNQGGFNIGNQTAGKNIFNIQGDYKPKKDL